MTFVKLNDPESVARAMRLIERSDRPLMAPGSRETRDSGVMIGETEKACALQALATTAAAAKMTHLAEVTPMLIDLSYFSNNHHRPISCSSRRIASETTAITQCCCNRM